MRSISLMSARISFVTITLPFAESRAEDPADGDLRPYINKNGCACAPTRGPRLRWAHGSREAQVRHRRVRYVVERVVRREDEGIGGGPPAEVPPGLGTARAEASDYVPARLLAARSAVLGKAHGRRRRAERVGLQTRPNRDATTFVLVGLVSEAGHVQGVDDHGGGVGGDLRLATPGPRRGRGRDRDGVRYGAPGGAQTAAERCRNCTSWTRSAITSQTAGRSSGCSSSSPKSAR